MKDINLYQDENHKGWILEVNSVGGWYVFGVYGTRKDALAALR